MNEPLKRPPLRMLVLITGPKLADRANALFRDGHMPLHYQVRGQGTASSEMMDILGLGSVGKTLTISMMPKHYAGKMLALLEKELELDRPGSGVAFTTAITGISNPAMRLVDENIRKEWLESMENDTRQMASASMHSMIVAIVNQGFSEDVMAAATAAGAKGGTVVHARHVVGEAIKSFLGLELQEEKEMVLILSKAETKMDIMKAVGEKCGMRTEAGGIVLSTPIDMIAGLAEGD